MLPLLPPSTDVAVDHQVLDYLEADLRARRHEAARRLEETQHRHHACSRLPPESLTPSTVRLLAAEVALARRRLALVEQALAVVEEAISTR